MTNMLNQAEVTHPHISDDPTPRATLFQRKYSLQSVDEGLLSDLKNAEMAAHMRQKELDLAILLRGMAEDQQEACEVALSTAMILADSQAKGLSGDEKRAVEAFGEAKKAKAEKGADGENAKTASGGVVDGLDVAGKGKSAIGRMERKWIGLREEDLVGVFLAFIIAVCLYMIFS
jgi:hypothetical protein